MPYNQQKGCWEWTVREDQMVHSLAKDGFSVDEVARALRCDRATLLYTYESSMFRAQPIGGQRERAFSPRDIELMQELARNGVAFEQIARVIGCNPQTLLNRFGELLRDAVTYASNDVANALFTQAMGGSTPAAVFWLKSRAGWKESATSVELTATTGVLVAPSATDPTQWIAEQEAANAKKRAPGSELTVDDVLGF